MRRIALLVSAVACIFPASVAQAATRTTTSSVVHSAKPAPIGTLSIPRLKVTSGIYVGITETQFNIGVGQLPSSPLPGRKGNIVIGGHRTSGQRPFANINKLKIGDAVYITRGSRNFKYVVVESMIVSKSAMWITKPTSTPTLTLFSCHPVGKTSHRIVIRAAYVP